MSIETKGRRLLLAFLKANDITPTAAARSVGVSHVTMGAYLSGEKRPEGDRRDAIAIWTEGYVPREAWRTREETKALDKVLPLKATGTD